MSKERLRELELRVDLLQRKLAIWRREAFFLMCVIAVESLAIIAIGLIVALT